jgi:hypothetical protein
MTKAFCHTDVPAAEAEGDSIRELARQTCGHSVAGVDHVTVRQEIAALGGAEKQLDHVRQLSRIRQRGEK